MKRLSAIKRLFHCIIFLSLIGVSQSTLSQQTDSDESILDFLPAITAGIGEDGSSPTPPNPPNPPTPPNPEFGNIRIASQEITQLESGLTSGTGTAIVSWNSEGLFDRFELNFDFEDNVTGQSASNIVTTYSYDASGQIDTLALNNITIASNNQIQISSTEEYSYANDRLISFTQLITTIIPNVPPELLPPSSSSTTTPNYSSSGQLIGGTSIESPSGEVTNFAITYDAQGRIATHTETSPEDTIVQVFSYDVSGTMSEITTTVNNSQRIVETFSAIVNNAQTFETRFENIATGESQITSQGTATYEQGLCRIPQIEDGFSVRNALLTGRDSTINSAESFGCFAL